MSNKKQLIESHKQILEFLISSRQIIPFRSVCQPIDDRSRHTQSSNIDQKGKLRTQKKCVN